MDDFDRLGKAQEEFKKTFYGELSKMFSIAEKWFVKLTIKALIKIIYWQFYEKNWDSKQNIILLKMVLQLQLLFQILDKK